MTEHEFLIDMLCSLPREILLNYLQGDKRDIPDWMKGIDKADVQEALERYNEPSFQDVRKTQLEYL